MMMVDHHPETPSGPTNLLVSTGQTRRPCRWVDALATRLQPRGVAVRQADTGRQAIRIVEEGGISLVILDAETPQLDGLSALRIIRSIDRALPCLLVAENPSGYVIRQALALQAYSVVAEPVDEGLLMDVVTRIFRTVYDQDFPAIG
jgi:CheY-like chemotaxis protein